MTPLQEAQVMYLIRSSRGDMFFVAHHGDCVGADDQFHHLVRRFAAARIVVHPGPVGEMSAHCTGDERLDPMPHMKRNQAIVNASKVMICAPFEDTPQKRGGTWATIAMAQKALRRGLLNALHVVGRDGQLLALGAGT